MYNIYNVRLMWPFPCVFIICISFPSENTELATRKLNNPIILVEPLFKKWGMKINVRKCSVIIFPNGRATTALVQVFPQSSISTHKIFCKIQVKYLDMLLDSELSDSYLISRSLFQANRLILDMSSHNNINLVVLINH
jgi:hypothetical protein